MLVHIKELFKKDVAGYFAYPAFNTQNLETTIEIVQAAEELGVPMIAATREGAISYAGLETIFEIVVILARKTKAPVALTSIMAIKETAKSKLKKFRTSNLLD
ncbi:MAG: class II fructose-bisphosphate aldolase [Terriglobia bacterium]